MTDSKPLGAPQHQQDLWEAVRLQAEGSDWKRDQGETLTAWAQRTLRAARSDRPASEWIPFTDHPGTTVVRTIYFWRFKSTGDWYSQDSRLFSESPLLRFVVPAPPEYEVRALKDAAPQEAEAGREAKAAITSEAPVGAAPCVAAPSNLVRCPKCETMVRPDAPACLDRRFQYGGDCHFHNYRAPSERPSEE